MGFRKRFHIALAAAALVAAAGYLGARGHNGGKFEMYKQHPELFQAIQAEVERAMSKPGSVGGTGVTILYSTGGSASVDSYHEAVDGGMKSKLLELDRLSEGRLSILRHSKQEGNSLLQFIFDWESAYGRPYHIVYSENRSILAAAYEKEHIPYTLKQLGENWYGLTLDR
jgi:hypothetical protein